MCPNEQIWSRSEIEIGRCMRAWKLPDQDLQKWRPHEAAWSTSDNSAPMHRVEHSIPSVGFVKSLFLEGASGFENGQIEIWQEKVSKWSNMEQILHDFRMVYPGSKIARSWSGQKRHQNEAVWSKSCIVLRCFEGRIRSCTSEMLLWWRSQALFANSTVFVEV